MISISESDLTANVQDGKLQVDIPVKAVNEAAKGHLSVSVLSVDGTKIISTKQVAYNLSANGQQTVRAEIDVPDDVEIQPDLVRYNLRVERDQQSDLRLTRSLIKLVPAYEVRLEGPATLSKDKSVTYRVRAQEPVNRKPQEKIEVELLLSKDGKPVQTFQAVTDKKGDAIFKIAMDKAGDYTVKAQAAAQGTKADVADSVTVKVPGQKILLTTDKPIYKPGQIIHIRALALQSPANTPMADQQMLFEVEDGKGNKILKKELSTNNYGIASTKFQLARVLNMGTFKIRAVSGEFQSEKTVDVSQYALPKFKVDITLDKDWYSPGEQVRGSLQVDYFFGKPVAGGTVHIEALTLDIGETIFQEYLGSTDADGEMQFNLTLPSTLAGLPLEQGNALATVRATVTDTADQEVQKEAAIIVAQNPLVLALVPESTELIPELENRLHLFASDPLGAPVADAEVEFVSSSNNTLSSQTDAFGHCELLWTPTPMAPDPAALAEAAEMLVAAKHPVIMAEFAGRGDQPFEPIVKLAETLAAPVVDISSRLNFPTTHPLNMSEVKEVFADADVVLCLDVRDWEKPTTRLNKTERKTESVVPADCRWIDVGFSDVEISGWSMENQRPHNVQLRILADTALAIPELTRQCRRLIGKNDRLKDSLSRRSEKIGKAHQKARAGWAREAQQNWDASPITLPRLALEVWDAIKDEDWVLTANSLESWTRKLWDFDKPYRHPGRSLGTATQIGISLGVALAHKGKGRLVVDIQPDGDLMFDPGALWVATKYDIPMLIVMYNNRAYFNDWEHQILMARLRGTDEAKAHIGMDLFGPEPDFAGLARSFGWYAEGPIDKPGDVGPALRRAIAEVKAGRPALVDTITQKR